MPVASRSGVLSVYRRADFGHRVASALVRQDRQFPDQLAVIEQRIIGVTFPDIESYR